MKFFSLICLIVLSLHINWSFCNEDGDEDLIDKVNDGMFNSNLVERFVKEAQEGEVNPDTKRRIIAEGKRVVGRLSKVQLENLSKDVDLSEAMDFIYGNNVRSGKAVQSAERKLKQKGLDPDDAFLYFKFLYGDTLV